MMLPLLAVAYYAVGLYAIDVALKPHVMGELARQVATRSGKPVLNVGAGLGYRGPKSLILGPDLRGDVNTDITGTGTPRLGNPQHVYYADVHNLPFPSGMFGASMAFHVLEHVDDPERALAELQRVSDYVFAVFPLWYAPHAWLQRDHRWLLSPDGKLRPLWR